jgi:hypothetical protein
LKRFVKARDGIRLQSSLLLIVVLPVLVCMQCSKQSDKSTNGSRDVLFPLESGNEWFGHMTKYDDSGTEIYTSEMSRLVSGDTVIMGELWYRMQRREDWEDYETELVTNRADGLWTTDQGEPFLLFKYPANRGEKYEAHAFQSDTMTVISTGELMETPAGEFSCYHYLLSPEDDEDVVGVDLWLAVGVGYVKIDTRGWSSWSSWVLDSMSLK